MKILAVPAMVMNRIQMLILVYELRGFRPFFLVVLISQAYRLICGESSYTQISGEGIDRRPEKSRGFYLAWLSYPWLESARLNGDYP